MNREAVLSSLGIGEVLKISHVDGEEAIRQRLYDIGMVNGTVVKCIAVSPLGDPRAYEIRGAVIALRKKDAANIYGITVETENSSEVIP
ncbi:MAG: ferrous iron transport protein A [Ruminococcaceae bacterium]|nr:ferrous iron transport protein A [Oscillospiraceae bacterium]